MAESLKRKFFKGIVWNTIDKFFGRGAGFVIGIVLARLLEPSDYGLIGMLSVFMAISTQFINAGMGSALIQKKECTPVDYSTVFVCNLGMALLFYFIFFLSAPLIADFYNQPILKDVTRVYALVFVIGSFNTIQRSMLNKAVNFKALAHISIISTIVSGAVGIFIAYQGFGVWALVFQVITSSIVGWFLFPYFSKWKVSFRFSINSFKQLFGYGSKLMATGLVSTLMSNISTMFIGKYYSSAQLGYYNKGASMPDVIYNIIYSVLGNVSFPILTSIQDDRERMLSIYKRVLFTIAMVMFPTMSLLAILSKPLVIVLYTEKWLPAVAFMQIWFITRTITPLSVMNINMINAIGRSDLFMKMDFSKIPMTLIMLAITLPISPMAVAIGSLCTSFIAFFINAYIPGKIYGYTAWKQIKDWRFILLSVIIMVMSVWPIVHYINNSWLQIIIGGIVGVTTYLACCLMFGIVKKEMLKEAFFKIKHKI